jgi:hypothetical protein
MKDHRGPKKRLENNFPYSKFELARLKGLLEQEETETTEKQSLHLLCFLCLLCFLFLRRSGDASFVCTGVWIDP